MSDRQIESAQLDNVSSNFEAGTSFIHPVCGEKRSNAVVRQKFEGTDSCLLTDLS